MAARNDGGPAQRRKVPIEGLPAERPRCAYCNRPIRVMTRDTDAGGKVTYLRGAAVRSEFMGFTGYGGLGPGTPVFDTLRCAEAFAGAAFRAGYRMVQKGAR